MPEFKQVITRTVAKTDLKFENIRNYVSDEIGHLIESAETHVSGLFADKAEFDRLYNTNLFYKYDDASALELSGIIEAEAAQIRQDPRFDLITRLSDARDRLFEAKNIQAMDEALARVVELMKQALRFAPGEIEMRVIKMLKTDERRTREMVDEMLRELKIDVKTQEDREALDATLELIFGTTGSKESGESRSAEIIRPDFRGRRK